MASVARKVRYSVAVSLDGYIASVDGSFEWLNRATAKAKGEDFGMTKFFKSIDTVLMGRKTYEVALKMGVKNSVYPGIKNYVFSSTLPAGERNGVEVVSGSVGKLIAKLKKERGKDIWLCGGGDLARQALLENAVDEITLGVVPMLVGSGLPAFPPGFNETTLELIEVKQYKAGVLGLTYKVSSEKSRAKVRSKAKPPVRKRKRVRT